MFNTLKLMRLLIFAALLPTFAISQEDPAVTGSRSENQLINYDSNYFDRYQPRTALDMVNQVPGFVVDNGDNTRGFGAAAGNVLINGRRPSAKQNSPSNFLARIDTSQVKQIELIRSQLPGIDMLGHSALVNIVLVENNLAAIIRWEAAGRHNNRGPFKPSIDISVTDRWRDIDYTAGFYSEREANGEDGYREFFDTNDTLFQTSNVRQKSTGVEFRGTFSASTWIGETLVNANTRMTSDNRHPRQNANIIPIDDPTTVRQEFINSDYVIKGLELGFDAVRNINDDLLGKAIVLFFNRQVPQTSTRQLVDALGNQTLLRTAESDNDSIEGIARLEFNWTGLEDHAVQLNLEGAYNEVDGSLLQTDDRGTGSIVVDVPGANDKVDEVRWDILLRDNWALGNIDLDYGLGVEFSTISQTGDSEQKRSFHFLKPRGIVTWSVSDDQQIRMRIEREVAQLDFDDFISTTVFDDNDVLLGNPNLRPDATWVLEMDYERRFGRTGAFKVIAFHHWIDDVLDLLPLTDTNAVPGNIDNGRRWGVEMENTIPLEWVGFIGAKLNLTLRWQNSTVIDPVTSITRVLSAQGGNPAYRTLANGNRNNRYLLRADFRQDLVDERIAWGFTIAERDDRPLFKVDELDIYGEGIAMDAFIETTRWFGVKIRLQGENMLDFTEWRNRTVYEGRRTLSTIDFRENREFLNGRKLTLSISGSF